MMQEKNMRFGALIRLRRLKDPRELTLKDVSEKLGISLTLLSDIENGRRSPLDKEKIDIFCEYLDLPEKDRNLLYDLSAKENGLVPPDLDDTFFYSEVGDLARHALRLTNAGIIAEEDWKDFIRRSEEKGRQGK